MRQQLHDLRSQMKKHGVDAYLIPTTDFHGSEYVNDYFKCRKYISGFTGSAGTLVITLKEAKLWTDGRYFLQAETQLADTGIDLMKVGEPGVPSIPDYLSETLDTGDVLGFDGRVVDESFVSGLDKKIRISYKLDLVGEIWQDRPALTPSKIRPVPEEVTGESSASKLQRIRSFMKRKGVDYYLLTKLDEIAWLFNLRGSDVACTPVFYAFSLITESHAILYVLDETFQGEDVRPYLQIFDDIRNLDPGTILLDEKVTSCTLLRSLPNTVRIISCSSPAELMKSLKNPVEISSTRHAHLKDGAAVSTFICWLKSRIGKESITEISAADYLKKCRKAQDGFYDLSFSTIAGYMKNGAIIHYDPTPETDTMLRPEGFLLVDSGGQYTDGTTDITRTIALGPLSYEMKKLYTAVLRCHIRLATAEFRPGTTGDLLDALTRKPLQALGFDYNHGTGHGVGHLLSVHEGPQSISPRGTGVQILPGMICSNEPGVYLEGKFGIRLENEILCIERPDGKLGFTTITFCPFEREAILPELLSPEELTWLNNYHADVFSHLAPRLDENAATWLKAATAPIA